MLLRFARSALVTLSILLVAAETNADGSTQTHAGGLQVGRPASVPVDPAPDAGVPDEGIRSDALAVFDSPPQEAMRLADGTCLRTELGQRPRPVRRLI